MVYKLFLHLEELDQSTKPSILASTNEHPQYLAAEEGLAISQETPPCSLKNIPDSMSEHTENGTENGFEHWFKSYFFGEVET